MFGNFAQGSVYDVNWFELGRMNMRNALGPLGFGNLADDDGNVRAYIMANDPTTNVFNAAMANNFLFKQMGAEDPGGGGPSGPTKAQQAAGVEAQLRDLAAQFGVSAQDWAAVSWEAVNNGWNASMLQDAVAAYIDMNTIQREGTLKNAVVKARDMAAEYYLKVTDGEALDWAKRIGRDEMTEESMVAAIRERAKAQYYWLAPVIDQGTSLKEYFKPHTQTIAELLETNPDSIDLLNDERWSKVIRRTPDSEDPSERAMNLFETAKYVRSLPEWNKTGNAKATAAKAVASMGKLMGAI